MPRVLGIDTSLTATGLARIDMDVVRDHDGIGSVMRTWDIATATVSAPKPNPKDKSKRAMIRRVSVLMVEIEQAIRPDEWDPSREPDPKPDLISIESLAYAAKGASVWVLAYIFGRTIELAERYDIPVIEVVAGQIKKYATGAGNADKATVMLAVNKRWPEADVRNDNESDAMAAGAIGCHYLGHPITPVAKYHQEVMDKVAKSLRELTG